MAWTVGDISGSETLTSLDHLYASHINELRTTFDKRRTAVFVGPRGDIGYITDGDEDDVQINAAIADVIAGSHPGIRRVIIQGGEDDLLVYDLKNYPLILGSEFMLEWEPNAEWKIHDNTDIDGLRIGNGNANAPDDCPEDELGVIPCNNIWIVNPRINGNKDNNTLNGSNGANTQNLIRTRSDALTSDFLMIIGGNLYNGVQNAYSIESHKRTTLEHCQAEDCEGFGIWNESGGRNTINSFYSSGNSAAMKAFGSGLLTVNGLVSEGDRTAIVLQETNRVEISGLLVKSNSLGWASQSDTIILSDCDSVDITGILESSQCNGLRLNETYNSHFNIKFKNSGQATNNTYSDILFSSTAADRNTYNTFTCAFESSAANKVAYHISSEFSASHTNNVFIGCAFKDAAATTDVKSEMITGNTFLGNADFPNSFFGVGITAPISPLHTYEDNSTVSSANGITIEQDGTGDAILQYLLTGTRRWVTGVDNSDSDKYKIAANSDVGTSPLLTIAIDGKTGLSTATPTALLDVNSDIIRLRTAKTPATAGAAGNQGDIAWDSSFVYVCTATDTWKRVAIATW